MTHISENFRQCSARRPIVRLVAACALWLLWERQSVFHFVNVSFILEAQGKAFSSSYVDMALRGQKGEHLQHEVLHVGFHSYRPGMSGLELLDIPLYPFSSVKWDHSCISATD